MIAFSIDKSKKKSEAFEDFDEDSKDDSDSEIVPAAATRVIKEGTGEDEYGAKDYRGLLKLRPDHLCRPLWVVSHLAHQLLLQTDI